MAGRISSPSLNIPTARSIYEKPLGRDGPFTPQVVVNGRADVVGNRISEIDDLIKTHRDPQRAVDSTLKDHSLTIGEGYAPAGKADIWFVTYDERTVNVPVKAARIPAARFPIRTSSTA